MEINNILFPTDFSDSAERALPHALAIARKYGARVKILHVRIPYEDDPTLPEYKFFNQGVYEQHVEEELAKMTGEKNIDRADTIIEKNLSPASGILEFATEDEVDLIVMGTHGRSAISHFLLGSVAEKIVRHAPCPVLTVADYRREYRYKPEFRKILAAFDFSDTSESAAKGALDFAMTFDASLDVLCVIEQSVLPPFDNMWKATAQSGVPEVEASARESLEKVLGEEALNRFSLHVEVGDADGKAEREIVNFAKSREIDLIVLGTHGHSGLDHALLGSTAERVVRTARCPVLTFHRQ